MGSDKSVQVLTLLKEISVLKELDSEYEAGPKTQVERRLVPPEAKIRQLCTRLLAAENDEASKRILHELREGLHKNYERLG